jgi:hypothetical protein
MDDGADEAQRAQGAQGSSGSHVTHVGYWSPGVESCTPQRSPPSVDWGIWGGAALDSVDESQLGV